MKISEDIKSISYIKKNTNEVLDQIRSTGRPVVITQNGEPAAILEGVEAYEERQELKAIYKLVEKGISEINSGEIYSHGDVVEAARKKLK